MLPLLDDSSWDSDVAHKALLDASPEFARQGHLLTGAGGRHIPFATVVDGKLRASISGIIAAKRTLQTISAPKQILDRTRKIIDGYLERIYDMQREMDGFQARASLFSTEGDSHTGMMVALYPPADITQQLAGIPGVETPPEDMHITLLYLGDVQEMSDVEVAHIVWATTSWARSFHPFTLRVNGVGRFNNSKSSDGKDVIYAVIDSHEIDILRGRLAEDLAESGVELRTDHGFNPHITLAYIEAGTPSPVAEVPTMEMEISNLSLTMGDKVAHYALGSGNVGGHENEPEDRTMNRQNRGLISGMFTLYEQLRSVLERTVVTRDVSLNGVAMQCVGAFERSNNELGDDWDSYHFLQEIYAADDGTIYAISVSGGRLYKWGVTVDHSTGGVELNGPTPVTQVFTNSSESRVIKARQREDGRYEAFAVLSTAMLNKDGQIDSRTLFDSFVEKFRGDGSEYINIYHIGHDATRIGELRTIFREGNVLVGYYVLDDNLVAKRIGETLASEQGSQWGGSIEFWTEEEPEVVRVADNIMAPVFRSGILLGYSIALVADGAAWGTKHLMVRKMNKTNRQKILQLLGNDEEAMAIVESWVDDANERTVQPGIITHTVEVDAGDDEVEQTERSVVANAVGDGTGNQPADVGTGIDEETVMWLTDRIMTSEWGTSIDSRLGDMMTRLADTEAVVATLAGTDSQSGGDGMEEQVTDDAEAEDAEEVTQVEGEDEDEEDDVEMQVMTERVDHVAESVAVLGDRMSSIESTLERIANRLSAEAPATTTTVPKRPAAVQKRPAEQVRTTDTAKSGSAAKKALNWKPTGLF